MACIDTDSNLGFRANPLDDIVNMLKSIRKRISLRTAVLQEDGSKVWIGQVDIVDIGDDTVKTNLGILGGSGMDDNTTAFASEFTADFKFVDKR